MIRLAALTALCLALLSWLGWRTAQAAAGLAASRAACAATTAQLDELAKLTAADPDPPQAVVTDLAPLLVPVLREAGLPAGCLASVTPEGERAVGTARRATTRITLKGLSLPQVGSFLAGWWRAHPDHIVTAIELTPEAGAEPAGLRVDLVTQHELASPGGRRAP